MTLSKCAREFFVLSLINAIYIAKDNNLTIDTLAGGKVARCKKEACNVGHRERDVIDIAETLICLAASSSFVPGRSWKWKPMSTQEKGHGKGARCSGKWQVGT